jgi:PD-(D/E)XK nuclease superfamily
MSSTIKKDFDFTAMNTFRICRQRYDYRINRGLVPKRDELPLTFGGAIHKALDELWKQYREHGKYTDVQKAVDIFKGNYTEDTKRDDKRTHRLGEWMITNYAMTYAHQPFKILKVEQAFEIPLPNGNNFIGRIDKIVDWDGAIWVIDHKTTSELGPSYGRSVELSGQFTGYVWAARQLGYKNCVGVIADVLLVAKGVLESSSRARLTPFARFDAYRTDSQIEEWSRNCGLAQDEISKCESANTWPMDGLLSGLCTYYSECPYARICLESPEVRHKIIKSDYNVSHWDPRDKQE